MTALAKHLLATIPPKLKPASVASWNQIAPELSKKDCNLEAILLAKALPCRTLAGTSIPCSIRLVMHRMHAQSPLFQQSTCERFGLSLAKIHDNRQEGKATFGTRGNPLLIDTDWAVAAAQCSLESGSK